MKVLFLTNIPNPYKLEFFDLLGKQVDLTVLFQMEHETGRDKSWKFNDQHNFKKNVLPYLLKRGDMVFCPSVRKYLKKGLFDRIVIGGYSTLTEIFAIYYLWLHKTPFILTVDGGMLPEHESKWKYYLKRSIISKATEWMSSSEVTDEQLIYYGAKKEKVFRYPFTSVSKKDVQSHILMDDNKLQIRSCLGISEKRVILAIGQFIHRKGFDILLKACANIPDGVGVYIIGGKVTEEYLRLQKEFKLHNVHFIEFLLPKEIKEYYMAADIFVLPTREDIWGLVINEAMASGLPVITTEKCVAGLEMIQNGVEGFIISTDNEKELYKRINTILSDDRLKEEMSRHSLQKAKEYTIEKMVERYVEILS